jgi:signal transduction histidine kinase
MSVIIDQLLELARFESGKVTPKFVEFDLMKSIRNISSRMNSILKEENKSVEIISNCSGLVNADPSMTEIMLENIISNSVKYSHPSSTIKISVAEEKNILVCSINNLGNGIPEEQLSKIFDRFFRVDESRNSQISGIGLGLAIVKRLADLQNIGIEAKSSPSEGTTFTLRFCL